MVKAIKAIKAMLIPNNVQKTKMFQYAGASRFAYNWALAREIENYEKGGRFISDADQPIWNYYKNPAFSAGENFFILSF